MMLPCGKISFLNIIFIYCFIVLFIYIYIYIYIAYESLFLFPIITLLLLPCDCYNFVTRFLSEIPECDNEVIYLISFCDLKTVKE